MIRGEGLFSRLDGSDKLGAIRFGLPRHFLIFARMRRKGFDDAIDAGN